MESYHQVETTLQDYEFDYEDYPEYGYNMVRTARPELSPYTPVCSVQCTCILCSRPVNEHRVD